MEYNYEYLFIDFVVTAFAYMILPFAKFYNNDVYTDDYKKKFILSNSILIAIFFIILRSILFPSEFPVQSFVPPLVYYYINCGLWIRKNKKEK